MTEAIVRPMETRWGLRALWTLQILLALVLAAAGAQKLAGAEAMVALFGEIGAGQWFRYLTGLVELAAAILLVVPRAAFWGAALAGCIMLGAIATHVALIGGSAVPALVLLLLAAAILWGRRPAEG